MASVTFDQATRVYPGATTPSVDKLDLQIEDGEFLVLVGPSGCGKSTSLRMLAGLEEVNSGRILIGDRDVTGVPPRSRGIGFVFQHYAAFKHMTVRDNVAFGLEGTGLSKADRLARARQAETDFDDLTSPDAAQDNVEIPAFLRRQAN